MRGGKMARNTIRLSRRRFLKSSSAGAAAIGLPYFVSSSALGTQGGTGANDRVHIGLIGTGIRGKYLIASMPDEGRVVAICDCHLPRTADTLEPRKKRHAKLLARFRERDAGRCTAYQDYRRMLDEAELDAVMIATPDHHHVLAAMLACQRGLDLYVEKPLSLTIAEGRALVEAVKRHKLVCQVGSQNRSMEMNRYACAFVRSGRLGKISRVQLPSYPGPMRYQRLPEEPVPKGLGWELFCGPTPVRPHNRKLWVKDQFKIDGKLWRGWDLWRSYSGHLMTNWGAHSVDMVQLALGTDGTGPVEVWPSTEKHTGSMRFCPVVMRYASGIELSLELPLAKLNRWLFHGELGLLSMHRNHFEVDPPELVTDPPDPKVAEIWKGHESVARPHVQNWLDCIKNRATPTVPVEVGHRSVTVCHLAGIARELRRKLRWDPDKERFPDDDEANALFDRPRRKGFDLPVSGPPS
jgi:predicted dehydrogenase